MEKKPQNYQQIKEIQLVEMMLKKSRSNLLLIRKDLYKDQIITLEIQRAAW